MPLIRARPEDLRRSRADRRVRACTEPARIAGPLAVTGVLALGLGMLLGRLGAPGLLVISAVIVVAIGGAVVARRTTASLIAGATLLIVRPYRPGEPIRLYAPEHGRTVDAEVVRFGPVNTTLAVDGGLLVVANTRLLRVPARDCAPH